MSESGPLWTRARLIRVMTLRYGVNRLGHVDAVAAARELGVTPVTVRRWLAGRHGRQLAHIPPGRLAQLLALLQPSPELLADEQAAARYARKAIADLALPRKMGVLPSWEKQRWLQQHLVAVIHPRGLGIRQIMIIRYTPAASDKIAKRGRMLDFTAVPTRFHATLVAQQVLDEIGPWRFRPNPDDVVQGYTWAWLDDAPTVQLNAAALRAGVR